MNSPASDERVAKEAIRGAIRWADELPAMVLSKRPETTFFFDGGLIDLPGFLEDAIRWGQNFDEQLVSAICRVSSQSSVDLKVVPLNAADGCVAVRSAWEGLKAEHTERACVLFGAGLEWLLYETGREDFGVFALYMKGRSYENAVGWEKLRRHLISMLDVEHAVSAPSQSKLAQTYAPDFLKGLLESYS
jgi:hypothetical protein